MRVVATAWPLQNVMVNLCIGAGVQCRSAPKSRRKLLICCTSVLAAGVPAGCRFTAAVPLTVREHLGGTLKINYYNHHPRSYERRAVFSVDAPAPTIRGTHREVATGYRRHPRDPGSPRSVCSLTLDERSQVQTFPDGWEWSSKPQDIDLMLGNAIPPAFVSYVGRAIAAWSGTASETSRMLAA